MKRTQLEELLLLKTLQRKQIARNDCIHEELIDTETMPTKNVCAKVSLDLAARLEETVNSLSMSKRLFIESAIVQALDMADQIWKDEEVDYATLHEGYNVTVTTNGEVDNPDLTLREVAK